MITNDITSVVTITAKTLSGRKVTVNSFDVIIDNGSPLVMFFVKDEDGQFGIWHKICSACHFGRLAAAPAILAVTPTVVGVGLCSFLYFAHIGCIAVQLFSKPQSLSVITATLYISYVFIPNVIYNENTSAVAPVIISAIVSSICTVTHNQTSA